MTAPALVGWEERVDAAIEKWAATGLIFGVETIREEGTGEPVHPNRWGGRFVAAHRRGIIKHAGTDQSGRRARRHGLNRLWVGTNWRDDS